MNNKQPQQQEQQQQQGRGGGSWGWSSGSGGGGWEGGSGGGCGSGGGGWAGGGGGSWSNGKESGSYSWTSDSNDGVQFFGNPPPPGNALPRSFAPPSFGGDMMDESPFQDVIEDNVTYQFENFKNGQGYKITGNLLERIEYLERKIRELEEALNKK